MPAPIENRLAEELAIRPQQVRATIELLDGGATVPFIARYRKEITDGLDDTQLRNGLNTCASSTPAGLRSSKRSWRRAR